jgi:hypothetical protein
VVAFALGHPGLGPRRIAQLEPGFPWWGAMPPPEPEPPARLAPGRLRRAGVAKVINVTLDRPRKRETH